MNDTVRELTGLIGAGTPVIAIVTLEEDRAVALCHEAAQRVGASFGVWSSHRGLDPFDPAAVDPHAVLDAIERAPSPLVVALLDFHVALADPRVARRVRDMLPALAADERALVFISPRADLPAGIATEASVVDLPLPDESELGAALEVLVAQWTTGVEPVGPAQRHRAVVAATGLTANQARRAFTRALRADPRLDDGSLAVILAEKKRILARDLGLEYIDALDGPELIGGLESFKSWLSERALAFSSEARGYGLKIPRGVMLLGVQGCGKSLSAKCAAAQFGVPLLRLDLPRVLGASAEGPSAEESLRRALQAAEAIAPVALWVDEIEKGFAGSTAARGGDSRAARLLGAFSTWLQERTRPVFVVATANDVSALPPELLRRGRFDELFFVDLPDLDARKAILEVHLRRRGRDPLKYDLNVLAERCQDFSGAELEQVVVGGLHRAFSAKRDLDASDLRRVSQDLVPLFRTYEEEIKALREWARGRARPAGREGAVVDLFRRA
ncbi:MAG: AAA family ATPase [Deltaproteobacteria bacterium]